MNVGREISALQKLTVTQLRERFEEVFEEACRSHHKQWLIRRIAWRLQADAEGDLSARARQRALGMSVKQAPDFGFDVLMVCC